MGGLFVVQQQPEGPGARDLGASDLHGNVRDDARHGDQRRHRQRGAGETRALSSFRLPTGGGVDRGRPLAFTFDGKPYTGFAGDSIASALLANGVSIVGRSFKYHRPRGIWGAWTEEPNAIVDVMRNGATMPNLRATTEALDNDIAVRSVNAAPTAAADRAALIDRLAPVLPAGFYYKTFLWPRWESFEGPIRAMAGLGRVDPDNRPPADNPQFNARSDLLVVGAGPAGLAAAAAGARAGRIVFLVDDHVEIGGQLVHRGGLIEGGDWRDWAQDVVRAVEASGGRVMTRTTAYGVYDGNLVCAWERLAHPPGSDRGRGRRDRAAAHRARQRPPRRDVRRRGARLSQALRGPRRQAGRRRDEQHKRLCRRRGFGRGRSGSRDCRHARLRAAMPAARDS